MVVLVETNIILTLYVCFKCRYSMLHIIKKISLVMILKWNSCHLNGDCNSWCGSSASSFHTNKSTNAYLKNYQSALFYPQANVLVFHYQQMIEE